MKFLKKMPSPRLLRSQSGRLALPLLASLVLGIALALRIAVPLWDGLGTPAPADTAESRLAAGASETDLALLQSLNLFAADGVPAPSSALPALNTALNLRLEGVMLAGDPAANQAVILSAGRRGSYRTGDELPAGANIRVAGIERDHVVIDNRGQREVLWLFNVAPSSGQGNVNPGAQLSGTAAAGLVPPPGTEERVLKTAARLAEIISVAPEAVNGRLVGYRLTPGMRLKEFVQLGFQTNDIVTAVNGIALNDVANLPKLYSLMDGATEVSFSLLRDGAPLQLNVKLSP